MKDLALSLLSRGYSEVVQTDGGGHYGRMEVYFEPEDYFNWKSQPALLRLTSSGRLLGGVDPVPSKTYSTRRGPLILYSEDLALSTSQTNRKGRTFRTSRQEAEVQLHTLQDLTEAILAYGKREMFNKNMRKSGGKIDHIYKGKSQAKVTGHTSVTQPQIPASKRATHRLHPYHWLIKDQDHVAQLTGRQEHASYTGPIKSEYSRPGQMRYEPRFLCFPRPLRPPPGPLPPIDQSLAPRHSENSIHLTPGEPAITKTKGTEHQAINGDIKKSFRTAVRTLKVRTSPIHEAKTSGQEELTGWSDDQTVTEHLTGYPKDKSGQWKQSAIETGGEDSVGSLRTVYTESLLGCSHLSRVTNFRRPMEGACQQGPVKQSAKNIHVKKANAAQNSDFSLFHLPPINQDPSSNQDSKDQGVRAGSNTKENHKDSVPQLPDIHLPDTATETPAPKPMEKKLCRKVVLLLPSQTVGLRGLLGDEEENDDSLPEKEEKREDVLHGGLKQEEGAICREGENKSQEHGNWLKATEQCHLVWFEPEEDKEQQTAPGPLPPFAGHRGPANRALWPFTDKILETLQTNPSLSRPLSGAAFL
ncbi:uncharacterized protein [Hoplias malabaricus]|uniref:uncharacterized protein n=1 Tax=Hoplias malabaricus TaxID=27720 RepID=UPI003461D6C2